MVFIGASALAASGRPTRQCSFSSRARILRAISQKTLKLSKSQPRERTQLQPDPKGLTGTSPPIRELNTLIEKGPPVQVAWHEIEDCRIGGPLTKTPFRLGKAGRTNDLNIGRDQVCNKPTHQIGTVNEE